MPSAETPAGISLCYETVGSPADLPLLLVMGYGSQMITWPRGFSELLAAGGRHRGGDRRGGRRRPGSRP